MDLKIYRHNLIVATEGRSFWILDNLPVVEQLGQFQSAQAAVLFKPADGHRGGGRGGSAAAPPTFYYWFPEQPTAPVTVQVTDAAGTVMFTGTGEPGAGTEPTVPAIIPPPPSQGGAGAGGGGGRGGFGGGGRGGFGGGGGVTAVGAHKGLNVATWNSQMPGPAPFTIPQGTVMWGGGGGIPKAAPGMYTVKVSMGSWSQTQTFRLNPDPRYLPAMTDADGAAQLKMALEVGGWTKTLYDKLAQIRDAKKQASALAQKTPALAGPAKTFVDSATTVEGEMTQLQGEAGQDALNFPGRMDNQLTELYSNIIGAERKLGSPVLERYTDLKPQYDDLMKRVNGVLGANVTTFNGAATRAGVTPGIVIK
jgi:hypothetical protein